MASRSIGNLSRFNGGISESPKVGDSTQFAFARSIDFRTDPSQFTILPKSEKKSGTVVTGLPLWHERIDTDNWFYDNAGSIYKRTSAGVYSLQRTVSDSEGNGMAYYGEDDYLHYSRNTLLGRYGPIGGTPTWVDDYLGSEGGVPLNTHSLDLESGSSMYATGADSASLSITGDITLEGNFQIESLPAAAASYTLMSKWNGDSDERSYSFDLVAASGYFGDGSDGALTISSDTTQAPTDSACTGTAAAYSLSATNASFAAGQKILIHQSRGTNAGQWERNEISSYTAGTISLVNALTNTYTSGAQVIVLAEYTNVTVNSGKTWTAKAWNGTVGGILCFLASGTVTVTGTITASGKGFLGHPSPTTAKHQGEQGEGTSGAGGTASTAANGSGGGGGSFVDGSGTAGGGGGGHSTAGETGHKGGTAVGGVGGGVSGSADLTTMTFGGGGGTGSGVNEAVATGDGSPGGGIIFAIATDFVVTGSVVSNGTDGGDTSREPAGGGGAGGSILIKAQTATLGTGLITANGGARGDSSSGTNPHYGGAGGTGRIHLDYYTSYTGTTTPTLNYSQDSTLVTNTTYQLRLWVSNDGTATESLTKEIPTDPSTATWYHYAVSWDASASLATFYVNGANIGTITGTKTAIYNSTALFAVGASFNAAGAAQQFFDGKVDDLRVWNDIRTDAEILSNREYELSGVEAGLAGYWTLDSDDDDITANNNDLTLVNTPTYSTDVPFSSPTTRLDLDQSLDTSGQTDTLPTAISEAADQRQSFVPTKDPQKSIEVNIAAVGTGNWTITVHNAQNKVEATKTVANADLNVGDFEFEFSSVWRPVIGQTYHFHITSTVADGTVVTTTLNDFETVDFHTYYQFLVDDAYHPQKQILNLLATGNERYLATWDGTTYNPHRLTFPAGTRVRTLDYWGKYLAIGCWYYDAITDVEMGRIFLWDGISDTYNDTFSVPEGGINSILGSGNTLYAIAGYQGDLMAYQGGQEMTKLKRIPKITRSKYIEVYPSGMTMYQTYLQIATGISDSTALERGVYSWGTSNSLLYNKSLGYDYPISTGNRTNANIKIGLVAVSGQTLFIGWQEGSAYGIDEVDQANAPYATATYETLISDFGSIGGEVVPLTAKVSFLPLVSGESVTVKSKIDRASSWTTLGTEDTADANELRVPIEVLGRELQIGVDLATTVSTSPTILGVSLETERLQKELNL